jgi:hypothetical protein
MKWKQITLPVTRIADAIHILKVLISDQNTYFYFYKEKLHTNVFLSILQEEFLPCPVHPALFHNFVCCYIILEGSASSKDVNKINKKCFLYAETLYVTLCSNQK